MSAIDCKVHMSLDDIIKMEQKNKRQKEKTKGAKNIRGGGRGGRKGHSLRSKGGVRGRGTRKPNFTSPVKNTAVRIRSQSKVRGGFIKKRYNKNQNILRTKSNLAQSHNAQKKRGNFAAGHVLGKSGLTRSRSRSNLAFPQSGFFTGNKTLGKRTSSLPNLRDPTSVHNRLGYQSPAQIAYRNRVKRAKQLLLQRQTQRLHLQNNFRNTPANKPLTSLQRALEMRQQALITQRRFAGGMRSDLILRAQRRAQYEQKLMRMNTSMMNSNNDVSFMCTLDPLRQRPLGISQIQGSSTRQLSRGRSPFRQNLQNMNAMGRSQSFGHQQRSRSRSQSHSRNRNIAITNADMDDRTFSEVMYSLSGGLGITDKTLNERFSF